MSDEHGHLRPGVRVPRGGTLTIPPGGLLLGVGEDGQSTLEGREILLATSIWLDWLEIAYEHLDEARAARRDMTAAIRASDEDEENRAAGREFKAALQLVTAAASSMEAFYGQIKPHVALSAEERQARINKRTARWKWVADALFRVASIPSGSRTPLRLNIKSCYMARGLAVHPEHAPRHPVVHQGLRQLVPYYVATFSLELATGVIASCVEAIMWVLDRPQPSNEPIVELGRAGSPLLHHLVDGRVTYAPGGVLGSRRPT